MASQGTVADIENRLLTVPEVAERFRCRRETVRRWIVRGLLPAQVLPSGSYRIRERDLDFVLHPVEATK